MKRVIWKRAVATSLGRSHAEHLTPCQDSVATTYRRNVSVIALADGAGSSRHSEVGSMICARTLCSIMCRHFDEIIHMDTSEARLRILQTIRDQLKAEATLRNLDLGDLSTTALAVAVKKNHYIAFHLGDGVIGAEVLLPSGLRSLRTISPPENGEYSNETHFVTSSSAHDHARLHVGLIKHGSQERISGFVLMSDGPEAALYRKETEGLAPACSKLLASARSLNKRELNVRLKETLKLLSVTKTHDDCSIALMAHA